jgi:hypothetical protein
MKKKTSRPAQSPTRFLVPAIIMMLVVMSACAVWNASAFDLVWIFGTFGAAILITMAIVAPLLLPIEDDPEERRRVGELFRRFLSGSNLYVALVRNGKVQAESKPPDIEVRSIYGVVVADSTSVVALRTETGTSRVEGPYLDENGRPHSGVIFTVPEEVIDAVIDLRPQLRRTPTKAQTRWTLP